ncbi:portal protein [Melghirimyces algeriensis]|uniref:Phage portal protein, SPP1 Gp6-like n=1 Tax=Melghirimyces algeriensis TaxID=910412 RepID=A0A521FA11_9BACL|nr:portal protein [Melghirimyces algeriensis]SMO92977.1 hypothetical protein SAMN06264849_11512 [Melghirimyces algeriensis]
MTKLFDVGGQFPDDASLERLAKYEIGRKIFKGRLEEIRDRALAIYKSDDSRRMQYEQLKTLLIVVNLPDILLTKPADLMVGETPSYETGLSDETREQKALADIVEKNSISKMIHETVIGGGYRGDSFLKVRNDYREDFSETPDGKPPSGVKREPIVEPIDPSFVFPETSDKNRKKFKAINVAFVDWVDGGKEEIPFLEVERHVPGYIYRERFRLTGQRVERVDDVDISVFDINEQIGETEVIETGIPRLLVFHIPYKTTDDEWQGISGVEKMESVLQAINERLVQIDYILWKHADPTMYGPDLENNAQQIGTSGMYIKVEKEDHTPGAVTWDSKMDGAFRELDYLIGIVYQLAETPQWLFGTVISERGTDGGTGTSHTDSAAIKSRFMPILSKVKRIRMHVDTAIRDALLTAMEIENRANDGVDDFEPYEPIRPVIKWKDGIPANEKELAEIVAIRTGNKPNLDVQSAIKMQDEVDDKKAKEIMRRIKRDEEDTFGTVDASIFNATKQEQQEKPEEESEKEKFESGDK